jgi:protein phosphatase
MRLDITPGDLLLICSDGLNSMITDEQILSVILKAQPASLCNDLIDAANQAGGHDNITVVTAQF